MKKRILSPVFCVLGLAVLGLAALCLGQYSLSPAKVLAALWPGGWPGVSLSDTDLTVIFNVRLPRVLLALLAGAAISGAGAAFQAVFSNPLATPDTLGVATGASFGAVLAILMGLPALAVQGAALATVLSQGISCLWILRFLTGGQATVPLRRQYFRLRREVLLPCLALGLSPFIMQFTESVLNICFNTSLLRYGGDIAVGAMTILASVMQFCMLPLQGLTQGAQPIVGFNYGAGQGVRVKETFRLLLLCCVVFSGVVWAVCMFLPQVFIGIFTNDPALTDFTRWAMRVYRAASLLFGIQIACQQTFIALGNAKTSIFLALLRKGILLIPLIYLLPCLLADQVLAVFLAEPVADLIAVSTTACLFFRQYKKL